MKSMSVKSPRQAPLLRRASLAAALLVLAGCSAGPDYRRPDGPGALAYTAGTQPSATDGGGGALAGVQVFHSGVQADDWWSALGSPKLDALIARAHLASPTLEAAQASLRQAEQARAAFSGSTQLPQASVRLGSQRQQVNNAPSGMEGGERQFNLLNASLLFSYDLDLAGMSRRQLQGLAAQVEYQRFQYEAARLNLDAQLALAAISQAQLSAQLQSLQFQVQLQEQQLDITGKRLEAGAGTRQEWLALQTQRQQLQMGLPGLRSRWEHTRHQLAVLAGLAPSDDSVPTFELTDFQLPPTLPLTVPSELLRQRPDVRAAEALLQAATAQYGVAVAKLYPQLTLSASLGSQALTMGSLFGAGSAIWGLGAQLAQPLFTPGLRSSAKAAEAGMQAAQANYQGTVLQSLRSVADLLQTMAADAKAQQSAERANESAQESLRLVQSQHALGSASYLQWVQAQQAAQQVSQATMDYRAKRLANTVVFYQTMGGGASRALDAQGSPNPH